MRRKEVVKGMKHIITVVVLAFLLVAPAGAAGKSFNVEEYTSLDELAFSVASYFPKVQGEVRAVEGDRLTIGLGTKNGLQPGMALSVWREGREILHPVTGAVIGRVEEEIGGIEVTGAGETASSAVVRRRIKNPKAGDKARITPKKISIALIPLRAERPELVQELAARLNDYGRFSVLDGGKTAAFLKEHKERDSALIKDLSRTFKLDVVAVVGIYPSDNRYIVTTKLFYADEARPLDTIIALLDLRTKQDAFGDVKPFFAPALEGTAGTADLSFDAQLFTAADLEGTGELLYALSDGKKIHIYKQGSAGWREAWAETVGHDAQGMRHLNLDAADINGDGRPEIFVTGMVHGKVQSYVIALRDGVFQRIADVQGFLRVVQHPRQGRILIGQEYDPSTFYAGQPKQYVWSRDAYVPGADFPLPEGVELYGFAVADMGEAEPLLVELDDENRLRVYAKGTLLWKSEERYPSVGITVKKPVTGIDAVLDESAAAQSKLLKVTVPGRVIAIDLNGDGRDEIVVPKNRGASLVSGHKAADFFGLAWTGSRLEVRWNVTEKTGAVLDYQVLPQQGAGARILALEKTPGGMFRGDSIKVRSYTVK